MRAMDTLESFKKSFSGFKEERILDRDSLTDIYESYYKKVYNYISYRVSNYSNVDELVSLVFEKVVSKYHTYRPNHSPLEAWIIGIAKNVVADYFRAAKKQVSIPIDIMIETISDLRQPEEVAIMNEENARLLKALDILSPKELNILSMKFATDLKNSEIAEIMSMSKTNVGTIINRSINKLRKELERTV